MPPDDPAPALRLLTAAEAADALRVCRKTVWSLTKSGRLCPVRIGRRTLYDPADLRVFIAASKRGTP